MSPVGFMPVHLQGFYGWSIFDNTSNRNGQHLTDFMIENRLTCLNTNYQKRRENYGPTHMRTIVKYR